MSFLLSSKSLSKHSSHCACYDIQVYFLQEAKPNYDGTIVTGNQILVGKQTRQTRSASELTPILNDMEAKREGGLGERAYVCAHVCD